jgi:iron complex transport system substrate-binding protein
LAPRVVSLHDVTSEIAVELGAAEALVGISELVDPTPSVHALTLRLPRVSSLESILALRPSLVVGLDISLQQAPAMVARLKREGVSVYLARPDDLDAVYAMIVELGARLGVAPRARALREQLAQRIEQSSVSVPEPRRVFVYDCCDPPFSAGGRGVLSQLIARAGGQNIFTDIADDWVSVSWEEVLARRPELVVLHAYDYEGQMDVEGKRAELQKIPGLGDLPSTVIPLGCSLGGLRSAEGLERLRQALEDLT